jgi:hypothetical protein
LEGEESDDVEEIWINEALKRYDQIIQSDKHAIDSDLIIKEAKSKYK